MSPDTTPILYACVSKGPAILAEIVAGDGDGDGDLRSLAARCLEAAPRFHRLYTRTTGRRIYAFLMEDPLIFFSIADQALGPPQALLFLRRLRDAFSSSATGSRRIDVSDLVSPLCFQDDFLPVLRQLVLSLPSHKYAPPPPPSPSSPPSDAPLTASTPSQPEGSKRGRQSKVKKKRNEEVESRMEIVDDDDADPGMLIGGRGSTQTWWRRHLWRILLIDLVVCSLLFAIWLSVCQGFQCIAS